MLLRENLTTEQVSELDGCTRMTQLMSEELERRKKERAQYDALYAEYVRQRKVLNAVRAIAASKCAGQCAGGGAIRYGCDPICTNIQLLNPDLIEPTPPNWGSLGNFVCSSCRQSVTIDASAGDDITVAENAVNQQMQCTSELREAYDRVSDTGTGTSSSSSSSTSSPDTGSSSSSSEDKEKHNTTTTIIIVFVLIIAFVLLIAGAIVTYFILTDDDNEDDAVPIL